MRSVVEGSTMRQVGSRSITNASDGTYTAPAGSAANLVTGTIDHTLTTSDHTKRTFNSSGQLTSVRGPVLEVVRPAPSYSPPTTRVRQPDQPLRQRHAATRCDGTVLPRHGMAE
ncbi:hypothetical protein ABIE67_001212 [Streptomyces sp. V4I8]